MKSFLVALASLMLASSMTVACGGGDDPGLDSGTTDAGDSGVADDSGVAGDSGVADDSGVAGDSGTRDGGPSECRLELIGGNYTFETDGFTECHMFGFCTVAVVDGATLLECGRFSVACTPDVDCVCAGPVVLTEPPMTLAGSISVDFENGTASAELDFGTGLLPCEYTITRS